MKNVTILYILNTNSQVPDLPRRVLGFGRASCMTGDARMAAMIGESRSRPLSSGNAGRSPTSSSHWTKRRDSYQLLPISCYFLILYHKLVWVSYLFLLLQLSMFLKIWVLNSNSYKVKAKFWYILSEPSSSNQNHFSSYNIFLYLCLFSNFIYTGIQYIPISFVKTFTAGWMFALITVLPCNHDADRQAVLLERWQTRINGREAEHIQIHAQNNQISITVSKA